MAAKKPLDPVHECPRCYAGRVMVSPWYKKHKRRRSTRDIHPFAERCYKCGVHTFWRSSNHHGY